MFASLNTKTEYSFLDSAVKYRDYIATAKKMGYKTIGISDNDNLHIAYRFIVESQKAGLQPVVSFQTDFYLNEQKLRLSFLALNTKGYHNLLRLSTRISRGDYNFADILSGVAVILPEIYADFADLIPCPTYIALEIDDILEDTERVTGPRDSMLAFPSVRYLNVADSELLDVFRAIQKQEAYEDLSSSAKKQEVFLRPEIYENYYQKVCPEALTNLEQLVENIHYDVSEQLSLPVFDESQPADLLLKKMAWDGLKKRGLTSEVYQERLQHELSVIHQMGFDDYFLIVADCLRYARESDIYCGMGRGSSAGSLVAYALEITQLDPVANNFLFERFLNPERVAMPDIDIDIPDNQRSQLLDYMKMRYGSDNVAQVLTFSTFGKSQALRDVAKAFSMSEADISMLSRSLSNRQSSLKDEYEKNQRFRANILQSDLLQKIYSLAVKIEGFPRQTSIHASAIVLSDKPLYLYTALKPGEELLVTQYTANDVESIGLLKIDFLGLNYLSLFAALRDKVRESRQIDVDPLKIDLEDDKILELFREGNTEGIFQFWAPAARNLLRRLQPRKFEDVANARAIRNPGSSDFSSDFIARRNGQAPVTIIDESLRDILAPTYGIMVYQEQVMQVTQKYAGFSLGKADLLRRAISKRKGTDEFEKLRADFINGAKKMGHPEAKASEIYDLIVKFAGFGFNRSHAYVYAALAVQIAYFKVYYPDEFYEVYLTHYDRKRSLKDALENGYLPEKLDINSAPYYDKVKNGKVRIGLSQVNGLPKPLALWIIDNRPFANLSDFVKKLPEQWQKAEIIAPLIKIGLFDRTEPNRGKLLANLSELITFVTTFQTDLFAETQIDFSFKEAEDLTSSQKYADERELLGLATSKHPIEDWQKRFQGLYQPLDSLKSGQLARVLVIINDLRLTKDRNGSRMAFAAISDLKNEITAIFFSESYQLNQRFLNGESNIFLMTGRTELRNDEMQLKVSQITPLEDTSEKLWLRVEDASRNKELASLLRNNPGPYQVVLNNVADKNTIATNFYVNSSERLTTALQSLTVSALFR